MSTPASRLSASLGTNEKIAAVGMVGGGRGFWIGYAAGWLGYLGLMSAAAYLEGDSLYPGVLILLAPASLSTIVAWHRRSLVKPEHSLLRTAGTLFVTGVVFIGLSALFSTWLLATLDLQAAVLGESDTSLLFVKLVLFSIVLYALLVGYLAWAVLVERVRESRALADREAVLRAKAEAKALRAQFNPHFVFNTLHSLMLLVREDPGAAERAIEDVASLIRYASNLERRGQDVVPLSEEIDIARKYLALESLRLDDRLRVVWQVADGLEDPAMPAFALQTLLENAIKHGLSPKPEGGTITIRVHAEAERLHMTVGDDGIGAAERDVAASDGSGLSLLEQRLRNLYGDAAACSWHTAPDRGFEVTLEWPRAPAGKSEKADGG